MPPVRTLIVDDQSDVRFLLQTIFADADEDVEVVGEADGAEAALAQLEALDPDVVVMDARMPRTDGFETAAMMLERRPGLPIVLCSSLVDDAIRARAASVGIAVAMSKDRFDDVPRVVAEVARRGG